jgi:hypothetical protein
MSCFAIDSCSGELVRRPLGFLGVFDPHEEAIWTAMRYNALPNPATLKGKSTSAWAWGTGNLTGRLEGTQGMRPQLAIETNWERHAATSAFSPPGVTS